MERVVKFRSQGRVLFGNFCLPHAKAPCIVISHGLESSKDGNKWVALSGRLCDVGFASLRFSYRGCGEGLEKSQGEFEDTTLTGRIEDFKAAMEYAMGAGIDTNRVGIVGSSFGGMIALAACDDRVQSYAVLATPSRPHITMCELFERYRNGRFFDLPSGRRLKEQVLRDTQQYDICKAAAQIGRPLLIIHGSNDETVPVSDAYDLYQCAGEPKRLEIIEGGNHSLDGPGDRERALSLVLKWFNQYL